MANISVAAPETDQVNKKREPSKATANVSANYLQVVTKCTLEDKLPLVSSCFGLPTLGGFIVQIPKNFFLSPLVALCKSLGHFSIDNQHFGGIREAPYTTCDTSTRNGCFHWHHLL